MWKKLLLVVLGLTAIAAVAFFLFRSDRPGAFKLEQRVPSSGAPFSAALQQTVGAPLRPGHRVDLLPNGRIFSSLIDAIGQARHSVHVEMYIWSKGETSRQVIAALKKRQPGVKCRVLLDALGSISRGDEVDSGLGDAKCDLRLFRKNNAPTARNHRKIAVVDGRIGFTGGFGIDDRWSGDAQDEDHWRDTNVRVEGWAVQDMQEAFAEDWQEAGGDLLPPSDFPQEPPDAGSSKAAFVRSSASPVVTRAERLTQLAIAAAHERLWISNAYFVPGQPVLDLLAQRASEDVDVRVLVPGRKSDSKLSFLWQQREYRPLMKRGVKIWEYQRSMMHAKTMVVDSRLAVIGSVNLDPLSLNKLEDAALVVEDPMIAKELERQFEQDEKKSEVQK